MRAAQLRARATRQAIIQMLLGTVFLIGALSYARAPDRHAQASLAWMSGLLVLSTLDAALGLRALVRLRLRRRFAWVWMAATGGVGACCRWSSWRFCCAARTGRADRAREPS